MTENERAARQKKISHAIMWIVLLVLFIAGKIVPKIHRKWIQL